ncbi:MAG: host attachment protein [Alphaproteobacteria bacterium]|nr:host attachment protein [Alphaproteobacteria bacterium]
MHERTTESPQPVTIWVVVADGKQAQVYECRKAAKIVPLGNATRQGLYDEKWAYELAPVPNGALRAESINDHQLGHTSANANSPAHQGYEPHGDIREELKRHFTKAIAVKLARAREEKLFDRLVLVAPAKMIGELREQLPAAVQHCVTAVLPKDLTHYSGHDLLPHLYDTLNEAHMAA